MYKLLQIWPSITAIAEALSVPYPTVASWKHRGVPGHRFVAIIRAAKALGHDVTVDDLAEPWVGDVAQADDLSDGAAA